MKDDSARSVSLPTTASSERINLREPIRAGGGETLVDDFVGKIDETFGGSGGGSGHFSDDQVGSVEIGERDRGGGGQETECAGDDVYVGAAIEGGIRRSADLDGSGTLSNRDNDGWWNGDSRGSG